jgi:hypothetical protein
MLPSVGQHMQHRVHHVHAVRRRAAHDLHQVLVRAADGAHLHWLIQPPPSLFSTPRNLF